MSLNNRLFLSPPHMSGAEQRFVAEAFESNYIAPLGPMVDAFEREFSEYTGIPYCLALSSGTAATHLALRHLGVVPGDVVLASTLTFIGSVTPATFERCELRFIDCSRETWNMDPVRLEQAIEEAMREGKPPKAVIPTDLYGQPCDLPRIRAICDHYEIPVICDSAEAMGARYGRDEGEGKYKCPTSNIQHSMFKGGAREKLQTAEGWLHAGFGAWASIYSFNGNKIMTTSGGGMLASHDKDLIEHARKLSQQARDPAPWYEHTEIGFNYRMSNVLAAIGRGQLGVLEERVCRKREILDGYQARLGDLPGLSFMPEAGGCRSNRWLTVVLIEPKNFGVDTHAVRQALEAENIEARPVWKPMHLQRVFDGCRFYGGGVSEELFRVGLCLPSGTALTEKDLDRVAEIVRQMRN